MSNEISRRNLLRFAALGAGVASVGALSFAPGAQAKKKKSATNPARGVKAYPFVCGILKTQTQYMLKDTRVGTPMNIPVTFFVLRHGDEWIAFDTGNNAMCAKDPVGYWGEAVTGAYYPVMHDYEEFKVQLKKLGLSPQKLKAVVLSHGHLDHAGAIDNFTGMDVPIYLQAKEIETIKNAVASGKKTAYIPDDFKVMSQLNIKPLNGIFDLFDDGTVIAFPTPGHTEGHQSLAVKTYDGKQLVLCADAMYTMENMLDAIPPGLAWDVPRAVEALTIFKVLSMMGTEVVPSHDPEFWKAKKLAPDLFAKAGYKDAILTAFADV
ncbi:MAG: N-acyl homoserine lactonase family protein [Syntrophobacteraceae bacterium]|jgi:glyoxylase-like metal-dependent hydrolase (beta-lactamase superfamily II)